MNLSVSIDLNKAGLRELAEMMTGPQSRAALNQAMGEGIREKTREHLQELSLSRHATAERLGASPSGHLGQAARGVESSPVTSDPDSATLTINHPGMVRALRDVDIFPTGGRKALAIPVNALAYNRRPGQFAADAFFVFKSKTTGNAFLAMRQQEKTDKPLLMYLLVRSVTQKQDRTLLPSESEFSSAAVGAADMWFQREIASLK